MTDIKLTGQLLVATPRLRASTFDNAVALVLSHGDDGALGVVINRPSDVPVSRLLPTWAGLASEPDVIFQGGPVGTDSALALVLVDVAADDEEPVGVRRITEHIGVLDLDASAEEVGPGVRGLRVYAGYAGWSPDQLEGEIDEGSWYVVDAEPADAFRTDADRLWRAVLRRQPGQLALMASFPADPTTN